MSDFENPQSPPAKSVPSLSPYDQRNPSYWIPRSGAAPPDNSFYRNATKKGVPSTPTFAVATFLRGFDIVQGEFYKLRDRAIGLLHEHDLLHTDLTGYGGALNLDQAMKDMMTHDVLASKMHIPVAWSRQMLLGLFGYAQKWWTDSLLKQPNMAVGSDYHSLVNAYTDVRLVLEKDYSYPKFDGYYQFQHWAVTLWYRNDDANPAASTRLRDFSLRTLMNGYDTDTKPTPTDMNLEDISFQLLKLKLGKFKAIRDKGQDASAYIDELGICYEIKDEDRLDVIYDDETFQSAIIAMNTRDALSFARQPEQRYTKQEEKGNFTDTYTKKDAEA
ncbi:hypothetical protein J4E93_003657 [Alternaria ventricosa]|uniref:uncharacterized protein n=1 Tax=Alternaria ventricosa TaxID=1187951 RepID=UPI0020C4BB79|nr:uncharacterized protein J4E93_003657 [Alternaria ventricosa]KAI4649341.1 hypothetical protein J4E93_003657 [Alternaria ventricosa]